MNGKLSLTFFGSLPRSTFNARQDSSKEPSVRLHVSPLPPAIGERRRTKEEHILIQISQKDKHSRHLQLQVGTIQPFFFLL